MKFGQTTTILFLWSCICFIDKMELSSIQKRTTETVCKTPECEQAAQFLLNNMNLKEDPCVDFYEYTCGNYIAKTKLPADRTEYGVPELLAQNALEQIQDILTATTGSFTPEVKQAQEMYSRCLIETFDILTLKNQVHQAGGWPITGTFFEENVSLEKVLAKLALTGTSAIISTGVDIDLTNSKQYILEVNYGELAVDPGLLRSQTSQNAYSNFIQISALSLGALDILTIRPDIDDIINFGNELAAITPVPSESINFTTLYQKMSIQQLQQHTDPQIDTFSWKTFFNELSQLADLKLSSNEQIGVVNLEYLIKAIDLVKNTDKRTVLNYAIWLFIENYAWTVGGEIQLADLATSRTLTGVSKDVPRNTTCTDAVNNAWGFALAKPYVSKVFPSSDFEQVQQIAQALLDVYSELLSSNVSYLNGSAQQIAVEKVNQMQLLIGYPSWINNDSAVHEYFKNYPAMDSTSLTNSLNVVKSQVKQNLKQLGTPVDRSRFETLPSDVTSLYDLSLNSITIPAALLQKPIFSVGSQLQALNYGLLGSVVGVQINNGIDYIGSQFGPDGNLDNWWSNAVRVNVGKDITCVTEQYNKYCRKTNPKICIDGAATALEHVADYDGALISFYAYEAFVEKNGREQQLPGLTNFTSEQLYFIAWAQQFCSPTIPENIVELFQQDAQLENRYRVIGALSDISIFASTFNCPVGPMNRGNESCVPF